MIKNGKYGNSTLSGLTFEKSVNLDDILKNIGYILKKNKIVEVYNNDKHIGYSLQKNMLYKLLEIENVEWKKLISKKLLPDDCFYNIMNDTFYILEKKYQETPGSVDEKPQTCGFKLHQYKKLLSHKTQNIKFCYIFNDWFKKDEYKDMLEYIKLMNCDYFFNEIPLEYLGIDNIVLKNRSIDESN